MKKFLMIVIFISLASTLYAKSYQTVKNEYIQITDINGQYKFKNLKYKDQDTLLFFFGSHCPVCAGEMSNIKKIARRGKLKIIGIHGEDFIGDPALKAFVEKEKLNFDVLSFRDDINIINDMKTRGLWSAQVPLHVLIDKNGNLKVISFDELLNRY